MVQAQRSPRDERVDFADLVAAPSVVSIATPVTNGGHINPISLVVEGSHTGPEGPQRTSVSPTVGQSDEDSSEKKRNKTRKRSVKINTMHGIAALPMPTPGSDSVREAAAMALKELGEPDESVLLLDMTCFERKLEEWRWLLPRVVPQYAVKCNADKNLMQRLHELGCSFDCATMEELQRAFKVGAAPDDVFFSQPCKLRTHLRFARARRVNLMSFADASELRKVAAECPEARLLLRITANDTGGALHFSAPREQWAELLNLAAELRLCVVGVTVAGGVGRFEAAVLGQLLAEAREVFSIGGAPAFQCLDLGGLLPCDGGDGAFQEAAAGIHALLEEQFPASVFPQLRITAEPGSFFTGSSASLLTKVFAKAKLPNDGSGEEGERRESSDEDHEEPEAPGSPYFRYYVNDGLYGSFNSVFYNKREIEPEMLRPNCNPSTRCSISGPESGGFDTIVEHHRMPELQEGDWLLWRNMGACNTTGAKKTGLPETKIWYYTTDSAPAD